MCSVTKSMRKDPSGSPRVELGAPRTVGPGDRLSIIQSISEHVDEGVVLHRHNAGCPCPLLPIEISAMLKMLMHSQPP